MRPLTPALAQIALNELNETPDRIQQDLIILRVWIRQQIHLRARTNDDFLIAFLRYCRYSLEETKKRIDTFFSIYNVFPEYAGNRHINQRILEFNRSGLLVYPERPRSDNHTTILIIRLKRFDAKKHSQRDFLQYFSMVMEILAQENDNASICGVCKIIDFADITWERLDYMDRTIPRKWTAWIRDCCPLMFREIFFLNAPKDIHRLFAIRRTFFMWRNEFPVMLIKDVHELYKHVPRDSLPIEYGGKNGYCDESIPYMEDVLKSYRDYFEEDMNYGTNEALRGDEVVTYEAEFGASGSFRKLQTD